MPKYLKKYLKYFLINPYSVKILIHIKKCANCIAINKCRPGNKINGNKFSQVWIIARHFSLSCISSMMNSILDRSF